MKKFVITAFVVSVFSVFASQLTGCAPMSPTRVPGVSFGVSPSFVMAMLPADAKVVESDENKIVTVEPSLGYTRLKTFTFVDGHLRCVKHQLINSNGRVMEMSLDYCQ